MTTVIITSEDPRSIKAIEIASGAGQWLKCRLADGAKAYGVPSQCMPGRYYLVNLERCVLRGLQTSWPKPRAPRGGLVCTVPASMSWPSASITIWRRLSSPRGESAAGARNGTPLRRRDDVGASRAPIIDSGTSIATVACSPRHLQALRRRLKGG